MKNHQLLLVFEEKFQSINYFQNENEEFKQDKLEKIFDFKIDKIFEDFKGLKRIVIKEKQQFQQNKDLIIIGISGSTRSGKWALAQYLEFYHNAQTIHLDDYFNGKKIKQELECNWELKEGINWQKIYNAVEKIIENSKKPLILVLEGFLLFQDEILTKKCDLRIFLDIGDEQEIYLRRMSTTITNDDYFFKFIIPSYVQYRQEIEEQKNLFHILDAKQKIQDSFLEVKRILVKENFVK